MPIFRWLENRPRIGFSFGASSFFFGGMAAVTSLDYRNLRVTDPAQVGGGVRFGCSFVRTMPPPAATKRGEKGKEGGGENAKSQKPKGANGEGGTLFQTPKTKAPNPRESSEEVSPPAPLNSRRPFLCPRLHPPPRLARRRLPTHPFSWSLDAKSSVRSFNCAPVWDGVGRGCVVFVRLRRVVVLRRAVFGSCTHAPSVCNAKNVPCATRDRRRPTVRSMSSDVDVDVLFSARQWKG